MARGEKISDGTAMARTGQRRREMIRVRDFGNIDSTFGGAAFDASGIAAAAAGYFKMISAYRRCLPYNIHLSKSRCRRLLPRRRNSPMLHSITIRGADYRRRPFFYCRCGG